MGSVEASPGLISEMLVTTSIFVPVRSARFSSLRKGESWAFAANVNSDANRIPSRNFIRILPLDEICRSGRRWIKPEKLHSPQGLLVLRCGKVGGHFGMVKYQR